jgi:DNA polymerase-3 subunit gamma/tau
MENNKIYVSLANKYRPKIFDEIIGQSILVKTLKSAIDLDNLANVFLFSGPYGTGKTTTARVLAASINCLDRKNHNSCLECKSCIAIKKSAHPDVCEIDAASNTGVDDVRTIIENSIYLPVLSKFKIYIIDEVHMLSQSAFNALLKTLEEPKSHVKFFLATTELNKIPMTVKSRCQHFQLTRPNNNIISSHIKKIAELEKINISQDAVDFIAENSYGSLRDALSILEQGNNYNKNMEITKESMKDILGIISDDDSRYITEKIIQGNCNECLLSFDQLYKKGYDPIIIFEEIIKILHQLIKNVLSGESTENLNIEFLSRILKSLMVGIQDVKNSINHFISAEILLIRLCFLKNLPSPAELIQNSPDYSSFQNNKNNDNIKAAYSDKNLSERVLAEFKGSKIID